MSDLTTDYIEKRSKFKRRAEGNLNNKVLNGLKQLGRCANRRIYAYDEQQVEKMFTEIDSAVLELRKRYAEELGETQGKWVEL